MGNIKKANSETQRNGGFSGAVGVRQMLVKGHKLPVVRCKITSGDPIYSMVSIINKTV